MVCERRCLILYFCSSNLGGENQFYFLYILWCWWFLQHCYQTCACMNNLKCLNVWFYYFLAINITDCVAKFTVRLAVRQAIVFSIDCISVELIMSKLWCFWHVIILLIKDTLNRQLQTKGPFTPRVITVTIFASTPANDNCLFILSARSSATSLPHSWAHYSRFDSDWLSMFLSFIS